MFGLFWEFFTISLVNTTKRNMHFPTHANLIQQIILYGIRWVLHKRIVLIHKVCKAEEDWFVLFFFVIINSSLPPLGSEKAVLAYRKALELKPNYVRAWTNMGISYANQGNYTRAATFYLKALSFNDKSEHVWNYLRFCFSCLGRYDLVQMTDKKSVDEFRIEFKF